MCGVTYIPCKFAANVCTIIKRNDRLFSCETCVTSRIQIKYIRPFRCQFLIPYPTVRMPFTQTQRLIPIEPAPVDNKESSTKVELRECSSGSRLRGWRPSIWKRCESSSDCSIVGLLSWVGNYQQLSRTGSAAHSWYTQTRPK
jgi:hypothetical protein